MPTGRVIRFYYTNAPGKNRIQLNFDAKYFTYSAQFNLIPLVLKQNKSRLQTNPPDGIG
jgi:hypothetical protein